MIRAFYVPLTPPVVADVLATTGQHEQLAAHIPHAAIRRRPETDKLAYEEITPIARALRRPMAGVNWP